MVPQPEREIPYDFEYSFKSLEEFFELYEREYNKAFQCFHSYRFLEWLKENGYTKEVRFYQSLILNRKPSIALQNFLQMMDFDVRPVLSVNCAEDTLIVHNKGKGYLYGSIVCESGVETEITDWDVVDEEKRIFCRGSGKVTIYSNGGYKEVYIKPSKNLLFPLEQEYIDIDLTNTFKNFIEIKGDFQFSKIIQDNNYVDCYLENSNQLRIQKKSAVFSTLIRRLRKKAMVTNLKIVDSEKILHFKIQLS